MTKNVVIALILFLVFCIGFRIKLVKNRAWNEDQYSFTTSSKKFARKVPVKRAHEKHMPEAKESSAKLYFARQAISQGTRETLYLKDFKCDFLTFHLDYIYHHYPQK